MRKIEGGALMVAIPKIIQLVAKNYGGAKKLDGQTVKHITKSIIKNFGSLGVGEIEPAFNLWSLGKFGEINAEIYGELTVLNVNRILSAYLQYRKDIITELQREERAAEFEAKQEEQNKAGQNEIDEMTDDEIRAEVEKCNGWDEIPIWIVRQVIKRKLIKLNDDQKQEYKTQGANVYKAEIHILKKIILK